MVEQHRRPRKDEWIPITVLKRHGLLGADLGGTVDDVNLRRRAVERCVKHQRAVLRQRPSGARRENSAGIDPERHDELRNLGRIVQGDNLFRDWWQRSRSWD